jgi:hypothetical protein
MEGKPSLRADKKVFLMLYWKLVYFVQQILRFFVRAYIQHDIFN